jgi:4-amino-4-deoxy-L-arabinose transferase-like glycosyltransferase
MIVAVDVQTAEDRQAERSRPRINALFLLAIVLMLGLRLVALRSDAYAHLSHSTALLTDEGFYIHNARNLILFGRTRTDDWNNMLVMPVLHGIQVVVFQLCGVGPIQARMIPVVMSSLTLLVFFFALRRVFGLSVAAWGTVLLGLDHVFLLYSRMALMDVPATLPMVCAFACFVWAEREQERRAVSLLFACGFCLLLAYAIRGLSAMLIPIPLLALANSSSRRTRALALCAGVATGLLLYALLWYLPHRTELTRMNRYYFTEQLVPRGWSGLQNNVMSALFGSHPLPGTYDYESGLAPYLFLHAPVQTLLAAACLIGWGLCFSGVPEQHRSALKYLGGWTVIAWIAFAVTSYAPSRYYVLFYPPLSALAAYSIVHADALLPALRRRPLLVSILFGLLCYQIADAILPLRTLERSLVLVLLTAAGMAAGRFALLRSNDRALPFLSQGLPALWVATNACWLLHWLATLTYWQQDADRWLATHLPPDTVLLGDVSPGVCLSSRFRCVNVMPPLCNGQRPMEQFASSPRAVVILDNVGSHHWKERWWIQRYPDAVADENRLHRFMPILRPMFAVSVYFVPPDQGRDRREEGRGRKGVE